MDQPYSIVADALSKFQSASEPIQALMVVMTALTIFGVTWVLMRGIVEICRLSRHAALHDARDVRPVVQWMDARSAETPLILPLAERDVITGLVPVTPICKAQGSSDRGGRDEPAVT